MSFPGIFRRLFEKGGAGPLLRKDILPPHADTHTAEGGDPLDLAALGGASAETVAALRQQVAGLAEAVAGITVDPWDTFPVRVPIAIDGVTFGGSDGRRAILPGEAEAREDWVLCDGGSDGKGGTVPDLRGRMILGASDTYAAGSTGGSATHSHGLSGTVGATTLSVEQIANHKHIWIPGMTDHASIGQGAPGVGVPNGTSGDMTAVGGSQPHTHSLSGASGQASTLSPYYALIFVMRVS